MQVKWPLFNHLNKFTVINSSVFQAGPQIILQLVIVSKGVLIHSLRDLLKQMLDEGLTWQFFEGENELISCNNFCSSYREEKITDALTANYREAAPLVLGPHPAVEPPLQRRLLPPDLRPLQRVGQAEAHAAQASRKKYLKNHFPLN